MGPQDGFESCIGVVCAGITSDAAVGKFRIDLSGNRRQFRFYAVPTSQLDVVDFGLEVMAGCQLDPSSSGEFFLDLRSVQTSIAVERLATGKYAGSSGHAEMIVLER